MQASMFQDSISSVGRVVGRRGVRVVFQGDEARTDGDTVYIPALDIGGDVNGQQADVIRGYRSHEALHVRLTDTSKAMQEAIEKAEAAQPGVFQLCNFLEDIRIENAGIAEYAGMRSELSATHRASGDQLREVVETIAQQHFGGADVATVLGSMPLGRQVRHAISAMGRQRLGIEGGFMDESISMLDPRARELASEYLDKVLALRNGVSESGELDEKVARTGTIECLKLAQRLYADIEEAQDQPPQEPEPGDGDGEGEREAPEGQPGKPGSQEGEGEGDGQGGGQQGSNQGEDGGDGQGESGGHGGGQGQGEGEGDGQGQGRDSQGQGDGGDGQDSEGERGKGGKGTGGGAGSASELDPKDIEALADKIEQAASMKAALQQVVDEVNSSGGEGDKPAAYRPYSSDMGDVVDIDEALEFQVRVHGGNVGPALKGQLTRLNNRGSQMFDILANEATGQQAMIRRTLELELQARFDRHWTPGHNSGVLNSARLVEAVSGVEAVYRQREDGRDMDTLIHFMVDASGSMDGAEMREAAKLSIALCQALERTGAEMEVSTWQSHTFSAKTHAAMEAYYKRRADIAERRQAIYAEELKKRGYQQGQPFDSRILPQAAQAADQFFTKEELDMLHSRVHLNQYTIIMHKTRKQRMSNPDTRRRLGLMTAVCEGGTPMVESVFGVLNRMARERHGKRILLVLTDGQPGSVDNTPDGVVRSMQQAHDFARRNGIHIIGIGFGHQATGMKRFFADAVQCNGSNAYARVVSKVAKHLRQERTNALRAAA